MAEPENIWSIIGKITVALLAVVIGLKLIKSNKDPMLINAEERQLPTAETRKKKYSIFLSSTYVDFKDVRQEIEEILHNAGYIVNGMEYFNASNSSKLDYIESQLEESDCLLLIVGNRYGQLIPDKAISYTEYEFDYADNNNMPILGFVVKDLEDEDNIPENRHKLTIFKEKIEKRMTVHCTKDELCKMIPVSLNNEISRTPMRGWSRNE